MADQDTKPQYLRLVTDAPRAAKRASRKPPQLELFLSNKPNLLGLVLLAPSRMRLLAKAIDTTRPRYIFDLRVLPAFEGAGLTRRALFHIMESAGCMYVDAMGIMGGRQRHNALLHSGAFEECVRSVCGRDLAGPMFFLFQSSEDLVWSCSVLPKILRPAPRRGWSMHVLGMGVSNHEPSFVSFNTVIARVQTWNIGEVLHVVASPSESTGWLLDERGRPGNPVNLSRGTSVEVVTLQIGEWTDVLVLGGPHKGSKVRLASNAYLARLLK